MELKWSQHATEFAVISPDAEKKAYHAPEIIEQGLVGDLTKGGLSGPEDSPSTGGTETF